jgi:hypothetical protein
MFLITQDFTTSPFHDVICRQITVKPFQKSRKTGTFCFSSDSSLKYSRKSFMSPMLFKGELWDLGTIISSNDFMKKRCLCIFYAHTLFAGPNFYCGKIGKNTATFYSFSMKVLPVPAT